MASENTGKSWIEISLKGKFNMAIGAVLVVVLGLFVIGKTGLDTLSGVRGYVEGEGLWSKGQKEASYYLERYAITGNEDDYQKYVESIAIPLSMKAARLELIKPNPDMGVFRRGLVGGGLHPDDVPLMAWLFRTFRNVDHIEKALDIWTRADVMIEELESLGSEIYAQIQARGGASPELQNIANAINPIHVGLDALEKDFSATLGEAARWAKGLLFLVMLLFTAIGAVVCVVAVMLVIKVTSSLQEHSIDLAEQNRQKSGLTGLHERMQGEHNLKVLLANVLSFSADFVNAQTGAVYLMTNKGTLRFASGYAFTRRRKDGLEIEPGEGLVGQAALEQKSLLVNEVPADYVAVNSALGEAPPRSIFLLPLIYEGRTHAVIELGSVSEFAEADVQFLENAAKSIAIFIQGVQSRNRVQELLEQSQQQAEELEVQQEELRQANEELEAQTQALSASEGRLRAQQAKLEETNAALEEKTKDLLAQSTFAEEQNEDLRVAQELLKEKAKSLETTGRYKSEFLANMSHELRTPLNSILLLSNLLRQNKDGNLNEKQLEFAQTITSAGNDLLDLINEVLDLSKIESGMMELQVEDFELSAFLSSVQQTFKQVAAEKGLEFVIDTSENAPDSLRTDEQRLGQVLRNLLANAFKFTDQGAVTLTVGSPDSKLARTSGEHQILEGAVAFTVTDTGVGIPEDQRLRIFEAFHQAEGSTDRRYGGTGLGLSISRELARLMGGQIFVQSTLGEGSSFTLVVPKNPPVNAGDSAGEDDTVSPILPRNSGAQLSSEVESAAGEVEEEEEATEVASEKTATLVMDDRKEIKPGDRTILIIEDDSKFARLLLDLAHDRDFRALVAHEGRVGLQMADYFQPSAVLLDMGLPDIDGMSIVERLKENLKTRHIPVHIISGDQRKFEALKKGAVGYLTKPVNVEQVEDAFHKIEEVISRPVKRLLVAVGEDTTREHIKELIGEKDVEIAAVSSGEGALRLLGSAPYDCMVLDARLNDTTGPGLLKRIRSSTEFSQVPVVAVAAEGLSDDERLTLDRYADRVILKDFGYSERLLDETALFLHRVEKNLPEEKRRMIRTLHDKEAIFRDKKVLIVDDDMRNVFALCNILEERQITTCAAANGKEALSRLDEYPDIDLVLMDIMMPEMDGYEAMRQIRGPKQLKSLPVIALTAKAMKGDRAKAIEAGASDYLAKPVDTDRLLSMLRVWLYK